MREDPSKPEGYSGSQLWARQRYTEDLVIPNQEGAKSRFRSNSLSGNERNRLFLHDGTNYEDLTLLSGADFLPDGRGFAWTDYDKDGFLDMIVTSLDVPRVRIMRNRLGELGAKPEVLTLQLSGANDQAEPSATAGNRDAIGARVLVSYTSGKSLALQKQAGEGFSVQNTAGLRVPLLGGEVPSKIEVRWPTGKVSGIVPEAGILDYFLQELIE